MDPKAKTQLVKAVKSFIVTIFVLFGEEGVRIIKKLIEEWLEARTKKPKATKKSKATKKTGTSLKTG